MASRVLFGVLLLVIGALYLYLAFMSVYTEITQNQDWVSYIGALLFLAAGVGAALAGVNLVRAKRR